MHRMPEWMEIEKMSIFKSIEKNHEQLAPLDIEKENGEGYSDPVAYDALSRLDE